MIAILPGLALGLVGSLHCVAMCGPLVALIKRSGMAGRTAADGSSRPRRAWAIGAIYHGSRVLTYALLGLIAGVAGRLTLVAGVGSWLSIVSGAILVAAAAGVWPWSAAIARPLLVPIGRAFQRATAGIDRTPRTSAAVAGGLNALLPCGMVYTALVAAMALGDPLSAALFMMSFGAGTVPLVAAVWLSVIPSRRDGHPRLRRFLTPVSLALVGLLLIGRGMMPSPDGGPTQTVYVHGHGH